MRRLLPFLHLVFATTFLFSQDLVLVGVFDLTVPEGGSAGKAVAVQATADITDLSAYGIGVANNGGGTDGQEYTFPAQELLSGQVMWAVRDAAAYTAFFGDLFTNANYTAEGTSSISQNGDDAIELYHNDVVVDLFGDPDVDGTGELWEYTDSWAFRYCASRTPSTTFDASQWLIATPQCTDNAGTMAGSNCIFPTENLDCAGTTTLSNVFTLQMPDELGNESQAVGMAAQVTGHVTGVTSSGFYLQDGDGMFDGVYVYEGSAPTVLQGDEVTVSGTVSEYYSLTQLQDPTVTVVSSGNTLPDALLLATGDVAGEGHEAVLVSTSGTCDNADLGFGEWSLDDGTGPAMVDDQMYATSPVVGGNYTVTGPLNYSFSNYKVEPRSAEDFVVLDEPDHVQHCLMLRAK